MIIDIWNDLTVVTSGSAPQKVWTLSAGRRTRRLANVGLMKEELSTSSTTLEQAITGYLLRQLRGRDLTTALRAVRPPEPGRGDAARRRAAEPTSKRR